MNRLAAAALLAVVIAVAIGAATWARRRALPAAIAAWVAAAETGSEQRLDFGEVADFDWDRVYFFPPYAPEAQVERDLGFRWPGLAGSDIATHDGITLVVFVQDGRVGWYFDPAFAAVTAVTPANRPALSRLAKERKEDVDDLISDVEGLWTVHYSYDATLPPGTYAKVATHYGIGQIDSNEIKIGRSFFTGRFPGKTLAENQASTILHEWTHAYQQTYDGDGWWDVVWRGGSVYIIGMTPAGQPIYPAPGIANRAMHADTWGWFLMNWYTP